VLGERGFCKFEGRVSGGLGGARGGIGFEGVGCRV